jgi:hypothetical protein
MDNNIRTALQMLKDMLDKQQEQINKLLQDSAKCDTKCCQRLAALEQLCEELKCKCDPECCQRLSALEQSCDELRCKCENNEQCCDDIENCCTDNSDCCKEETKCCVEKTCCDNSVVDDVLNN